MEEKDPDYADVIQKIKAVYDWSVLVEIMAGEDYGLSSDVSQLWVAERLRQVSDSLVDRLAEKAVQHGTSKSNVARAADSDPTNAMRRFPRLRPGADRTRLLIDEVLDSLE